MNSNQSLPGDKPLNSFIERLQTIDDPRDNRGKRHILAFVLAGVILGIMAGRQSTSSIYRFIRNRIDWLRDVTGFDEAKPISRAQLPRILSIVDLEQLNEIVEMQLGIRLETENTEWSFFELETTTESQPADDLNHIKKNLSSMQNQVDSSQLSNALGLLEIEENKEQIIDSDQQAISQSQADCSQSSRTESDLSEIKQDKEQIMNSDQQAISQSQTDCSQSPRAESGLSEIKQDKEQIIDSDQQAISQSQADCSQSPRAESNLSEIKQEKEQIMDSDQQAISQSQTDCSQSPRAESGLSEIKQDKEQIMDSNQQAISQSQADCSQSPRAESGLSEIKPDKEQIMDSDQQVISQSQVDFSGVPATLSGLSEIKPDKERIIDSGQQAISQSQVDSNCYEWLAYDGKSLRGTEQERILLAVTHTERRVLAQRPMSGPKRSEVIAVRELLPEPHLANYNVTLDALHLAPLTTTMIAESGRNFIIQAKANQPTLMRQLKQTASEGVELGKIKTVGKGHGRIEKRCATFFSVSDLSFAARWAESDFQTLIVMERERLIVKKNKHTSETSYYLSNKVVNHGDKETQRQVAGAIRTHWQIETHNHIRDTTFGEDSVKTKNSNMGQVMSVLRTLVIGLFGLKRFNNLAEAIENFVDDPNKFKEFLEQVNFL